jgi:integrase
MYYQLKPGKKNPRVCVYHWKDGKQVQIPRKLTKHLDGKPEAIINDWMVWYAATRSIALRTIKREFNSRLEALLERYKGYLQSRRKHPNTVKGHMDRVRLALPVFADADLDSWFLLGGKLEEHLRDHVNPHRHNRINQSFKAFYIWLQQVNEIKHRHGLLLANRVTDESKTPLQFTLTPDQVLAWAKACASAELKFIALAGFFFSLRTGEVFGARRKDFVAGSAVQAFEDYKALNRIDRAAKLAINITNCRNNNGKDYKPSARKRGGIVVCTHTEAAKLLAKLINARDGYIIPPKTDESTHKPEYWVKLWRKRGIPGITIKDLRRASLYWLGHYTDIPFVALKNHARHRDPETTALYVRRPEEAFDTGELKPLDLEA